ncbi:MAG: chemotaxis protein CheW [Alphaproteobacteria bacterium]|nr:chemotaxis protein CheW [Alphaproteobacteria bacterium]
MSEAATTVREATQYVTLGLDRELFAVEVARVREILDMQPVSRIPYAPSFVTGMIDVRGSGVPVIDLRIKLGLPPVPPTEQTRIIVLEIGDGGRTRLMGLMADRVFEVTPLADHSLEPPPEVGARWRSDYIKAIGRRGTAFVIIFDLAKLFTSDEVALVEGGREREGPG